MILASLNFLLINFQFFMRCAIFLFLKKLFLLQIWVASIQGEQLSLSEVEFQDSALEYHAVRDGFTFMPTSMLNFGSKSSLHCTHKNLTLKLWRYVDVSSLIVYILIVLMPRFVIRWLGVGSSQLTPLVHLNNSFQIGLFSHFYPKI